MDIQENELDSGLHQRQAMMKQGFVNRSIESQYKSPLNKVEEISVSASELSEREIQFQDNNRNIKNDYSKQKTNIQNLQYDANSPHSLAYLSNQDITIQDNLQKSVDNKFKFKQTSEDNFQSSQFAFQNSANQLNKERHFQENNFVENSSDGKNKKNSVSSSKHYLSKTQPQEGENGNSQDSKTNQKNQSDQQDNPIQNRTLKHMIHHNKVNNIKNRFINNLITSCPSLTFKHLTKKQFGIINDSSSDFGYFIHNTNQLIFSEVYNKKDVAIVIIYQYSKTIRDESLFYYLDYIIFLKYIDIPPKLQELETKLQVSQTKLNWIKLIKLECLVILIAHVACCIFLRIGIAEMKKNKESWITKFEYDQNSNQKNYVISLYYIIITMTTIGYGDISPYTLNEKVFMILVAIIATNICAYSYTQINEIVKYEEQKKQTYKQTMQGINNEMNKMGLNILLQHKVRKHFEFQLYQEEEKKKYSENLFDVLPKPLKEEVLQELTEKLSNEIVVLRNMSSLCLKEVRNSMKQKVLFPDEIIIKNNQLDNCIYYVAQGSVTLSIPVQVLSNEKMHKTPFMNVKTLTKNSSFGYEGFILEQVSPYTIKSDGVGFLLLIQKDEFMNILQKYPRDQEMYMMLKDEALFNSKTESIIQNCMSCSNPNHQISSCPYVNYQKKRWKKSLEEEAVRQKHSRQNKDRTKTNCFKNLAVYQDEAKQFVLTQQRDEEINELYNLLKSNKQSTQNGLPSSETTNSESDMTEYLEEDSSSFANFINTQKIISSLKSNLTHNQHQKINQIIPKEPKGLIEFSQIKLKKESLGSEIKKNGNSDNIKNINIGNTSSGVQSRQLQVIEEGEEDTIQQSVNKSLDSLNKKTYKQDTIIQTQSEDKQYDKNNSKQIDHSRSSNSSSMAPSQSQYEKITNHYLDYQEMNVAPAQIYSTTSILNDRANSSQLIEDNNNGQLNISKSSLNVSASLQQIRQGNNNTNQIYLKKTSSQSPYRQENSKKRNSQTSIKDLNKFEMNKSQLEDQCDIDDDQNNKSSGQKQQSHKELTFQDEMFNIYQKNAKKMLRSERNISSYISKELESPKRMSVVSNLIFDDFTSPVLLSPKKRKNKQAKTIVLQNLEHIDTNLNLLHYPQSISQSYFDSEGQIQQVASNQQLGQQTNIISTSPLILQKRNSQRQLPNQVKFSQNIPTTPINTTPRNSLPQVDQYHEIQRSKDQKINKTFSQVAQLLYDQSKSQPQSTSPRNSIIQYNSMNQSLTDYKQQTLQNLNQYNSQGRTQTFQMFSSGELQQYSSEWQIKFKEGLLDLDMLIVRKNLKLAYEKGYIKNDIVKVQDNEIDIDIMKHFNFYYPQKNAKVVVFKLRRNQKAQNSKKSKIASKMNIESKKKIRKSRQTEFSNLSIRNLTTKPNSSNAYQRSRPSLMLSQQFLQKI